MGKIYYMMGKSSSGKDTLFKEVKEALPELRTVTLYTTRPIREGEKDGVEYFFVTDEVLDDYGRRGLVVEERGYHTVCGLWRYATVDDGQIDLAASDYLVIGTLESYERCGNTTGQSSWSPSTSKWRTASGLQEPCSGRRAQAEPKYAEMCPEISGGYKGFFRGKSEEAGDRETIL